MPAALEANEKGAPPGMASVSARLENL